jgi:hypothetical protein
VGHPGVTTSGLVDLWAVGAKNPASPEPRGRRLSEALRAKADRRKLGRLSFLIEQVSQKATTTTTSTDQARYGQMNRNLASGSPRRRNTSRRDAVLARGAQAPRRHSSCFGSGNPRLFRPVRSGLSRNLWGFRRDLHQQSESRRDGGGTDDRTGSHQPFPA